MNHPENHRDGSRAADLSDSGADRFVSKLPCPTPATANSAVLPGSDAMATLENATVDLGRKTRCRFGEVIYGEGKSPELITSIAQTLLQNDAEVLITRLTPEAAAQVASAFTYAHHDPVARTLRVARQTIAPYLLPTDDETCPIVAVVTAGSTDRPVAAEAVQTLSWMRVVTDSIHDVGVAGPQRLLAVLPRIQRASIIVVVAGMEGALASVVGGHVACPVIAVPTSVGYGSCFGGMTALLAMSVSCASNVSVVGIDAGFKGGYVAGLIATQLQTQLQKISNQSLHRSSP